MTDRDNPPAFRCPSCNSVECDRVEVDIGVGTQYGPWQCFNCGWTQPDEISAMFGEKPDA